MQNVAISDNEIKNVVPEENWSIRECTKSFMKNDNNEELLNPPDCSWEEELYFKGSTAVWSKGDRIVTCYR